MSESLLLFFTPFSTRLPVTETPNMPFHGEAQRTDETSPAGSEVPAHALIVLVDDNDDVRETIGELLTDAGYTVLTFASGETALADPSLIAGAAVLIADIVLGGDMDGVALAEAFKQRVEGIRVIYITGYFTARRVRALRPQDRFLRKPFGIDELLRALQ
jgi:DNA-binding NtrC family response regulator